MVAFLREVRMSSEGKQEMRTLECVGAQQAQNYSIVLS